MGLGAGSTATGIFSNLYPCLYLETVFPALKLTQNCYLHYNIYSYATCRTERLSSPSEKIEGKETSKIPIFQLLRKNGKKLKKIGKKLEVQPRLFKNPNFTSLSRIGKNIEVSTAQDQHFKIQILKLWMNWENLCPNLSFTVENKMENSHKERMVTFQT